MVGRSAGSSNPSVLAGSDSSFTPFSLGKRYETERKYLKVAGLWFLLSGSRPGVRIGPATSADIQ